MKCPKFQGNHKFKFAKCKKTKIRTLPRIVTGMNSGSNLKSKIASLNTKVIRKNPIFFFKFKKITYFKTAFLLTKMEPNFKFQNGQGWPTITTDSAGPNWVPAEVQTYDGLT